MHLVPVACLGLGPIGQRLARRLADQEGVRLVAGIDTDLERTGRDLGALIGRDLDAPITDTLPTTTDGGVLVQATVSRLAAAVPQAIAAVEAGWNVVSTCEELVHRNGEALLLELDSAARAAGRTVVAAGINPGFLMDVLPLVLSGACTRVDRVRVRRIVDTDQRREPLQRKAGVGLSEAEFRSRAAAGDLGHVGLRQSAELLAAGLGWEIEDYAETLEPVLADEPARTGLGPIAVGSALGQRQTAELRSGGDVVIAYELQMSAGASPVDEIELTGDPTVRQRIEGGVNGDVGTVAVISNLVPAVAAAAPGLLTIGELLPLRNRRSRA